MTGQFWDAYFAPLAKGLRVTGVVLAVGLAVAAFLWLSGALAVTLLVVSGILFCLCAGKSIKRFVLFACGLSLLALVGWCVYPAVALLPHLESGETSKAEVTLIEQEKRLDRVNARFWNHKVFDQVEYESIIRDVDGIDWQSFEQQVRSGHENWEKADQKFFSTLAPRLKLVGWLHKDVYEPLAKCVATVLGPAVDEMDSTYAEISHRQSSRESLYPLRRDARYEYIIALVKHGDNERAIELLREIIKIDPDDMPVNGFLILSAHTHALSNQDFVKELEQAAGNSPGEGPDYLKGRIREYEQKLSEIPIDYYRPLARYPGLNK